MPCFFCRHSDGQTTHTPRTLILVQTTHAQIDMPGECGAGRVYVYSTKKRVFFFTIVCFFHQQVTRGGLREISPTQYLLTVRQPAVRGVQQAADPGRDVSLPPQQQLLDCDVVGPPDTVSNIRPLRLREPVNESVSRPLCHIPIHTESLILHVYTYINVTLFMLV